MKNTRKFLGAILSIILALAFTLCLFGCDIIGDVIGNEDTQTEVPATTVSDTTTTANTESTEDENTVEKSGLWENATYLKNMTFGEGSKTVLVEVKAGNDSVTFTIKTDKKTVGEALVEHKLIEGEDGQFGMYIKKVNGILADYDVNRSYWSFYINGEYAMSGVDTTDIDTSATYKLEYTK